MAKMDFLFDLLSYRDRGRVQRAREPLLSPHHLHLSTTLAKSLVEPYLIFLNLALNITSLDSKYDALSSVFVEKGQWGYYGGKFYDDISSLWVTSPPWNGEQCIFEWQHKTSRPALKLNISFDCTFSTLHCDVPNLAETFKLLFIQKLLPKCQSPEMEQILHNCCSKVRLVTKYCKFNWQLFPAKKWQIY